MTRFEVQTIPGVAVWQGNCLHCQAKYAVMHIQQDDAPRLTTCPFCGHRAVYTRQEQEP